jgi:hypothetical protein
MTAARVATDQLTRALLNMAARGERTHCSDPTSHHLWTSEHDAERAVAVMLCDHCPILTVCRDTAELRQETWGVSDLRSSIAPLVDENGGGPVTSAHTGAGEPVGGV